VSPSYWLEEPGKHGGAWGFNTETSPGPAPMVAGSLRKTMPADEIWPPNAYWHFHSGSGNFQRLATFDDGMKEIYGAPKSLADYEAKAQAMTYEGERAMFEAYRRNKFNSTGVIQWMLNNAWPSLYWHLFDFYLQPAGGYFGAKKANEMLHVQYSYDDRSVVVVNGYYHNIPQLTVTAQVYDFNLKLIFSRRVEVDSAENSSQGVLTLPDFPKTPMPRVFFVRLRLQNHAGVTLSRNFYWISNKPAVFEWYWTTFVRTEELSYEDCRELEKLPSVKLAASANLEMVNGDAVVRVHLRNPGSHLAFQVRLAVKDKNGEERLPVFWDDNYTELMPGESRTITAKYPSWIKLGSKAELDVTGWNIMPAKIPLATQVSGAKK
jgi:exo-1,4-beta-D-glucosaminidase